MLPLLHRLSRRARTYLIGGLLTCLAMGAVLWIVLALQAKSVDRLRQELEREVPIGSPMGAVNIWAAKHGRSAALRTIDPATLPGPKLYTVAGFAEDDLRSFAEVDLPWGHYSVNGTIARNHLWVFIIFDEHGLVKGYRFLTLAELAEHERGKRDP